LEHCLPHERCVRWDDPEIGIPWPIRGGVLLSERDKRCLPLREAETNFFVKSKKRVVRLVFCLVRKIVVGESLR